MNKVVIVTVLFALSMAACEGNVNSVNTILPSQFRSSIGRWNVIY